MFYLDGFVEQVFGSLRRSLDVILSVGKRDELNRTDFAVG